MKIKHLVLALLAAALVAGCGGRAGTSEQSDPGATVPAVDAVAYVNGEPISREMFEFHLDRRTQGQPQLADAEARQMLLNELVELTLLAQEANRQQLDQDPAVAARVDNLRAAVLAQALVEQMSEQTPDETAIQAEYDKLYGGEAQQEYHARHILVENEEEATQVIAELDEGGDFVKLAEARSDGPTGPDGGDLGWFQAEQMVEPFAEAVQRLEPGQYTKTPVQTQFGWHVILLEGTREATPPSLEELRPQLANLVAQQRIEQRLEELREQAEVSLELDKAQPQSEAAAE